MANTTYYYFNKPTVGGSSNSWGGDLNENWEKLDRMLNGSAYTDTDSNTVEKIKPDLIEGSWQINGTNISASGDELNKLDGATVTTAQLNILGSITSTAAEINLLDDCTASTAELNHTTGVTSALQTQIDGKVTTARTVDATGNGLTGGGDLTANRTIAHADTSSQASVDNASGSFIQDVTLDEFGHVTALTSATVTSGLGDGQSWTDVASSRSPNVWYENATGRPIFVSAQMLDGYGYVADSSSGTNTIAIAFDDGDSNTWSQLHMIIPADKFYKCSGTKIKWVELR
jgi:hypothetical protein